MPAIPLKQLFSSPKLLRTLSAAAIAFSLATYYEGTRYEAFPDVATGQPTICLGHTKGVHFGDKATPAECQKLYDQDEKKHEAWVRKIVGKQPETRIGALTDFCYNLGDHACRKVLARIAAGNIAGGCASLKLYECAGLKPGQSCTEARKLPGLVKRRGSKYSEYALCMMEPQETPK